VFHQLTRIKTNTLPMIHDNDVMNMNEIFEFQ
jgi:hypothetical protein